MSSSIEPSSIDGLKRRHEERVEARAEVASDDATKQDNVKIYGKTPDGTGKIASDERF